MVKVGLGSSIMRWIFSWDLEIVWKVIFIVDFVMFGVVVVLSFLW